MPFPKFAEFLRTTKVSDVCQVKKADLVVLKADQTLGEALKTLTAKRILSAPVQDGDKFIGFVDMLDLVTAAAVMESAKSLVDSLAKKEVAWDAFIDQENRVFGTEKIGALVNASERNPLVTVAEDQPLADLLRAFVGGSTGTVHRVAVVQPGAGDASPASMEQLISLVTQSDLVKFLADRVFEFPAVLTKLSQTDVRGQKKIVSVQETETALAGFLKMVEEKVSCVGVVAKDSGELIGCLSASDFKRAPPPNVFADLHTSVRAYLTFSAPPGDHVSWEPVVCTVNDSFADIIDKMAKNRLHRLFIVEPETRKPDAVIATADIIMWFLVCTQLESTSHSQVIKKSDIGL